MSLDLAISNFQSAVGETKKSSNNGQVAVDAAPSAPPVVKNPHEALPNARGRFGRFGGAFVPETLVPAIREIEAAYREASQDRAFQEEFDHLMRTYVGRPTPLTYAKRLTEELGGAKIYLKREDQKTQRLWLRSPVSSVWVKKPKASVVLLLLRKMVPFMRN